MPKEHLLRLRVNGARKSFTVLPGRTLSELLAGECACASVRESCDDGTCGSCLVSVDGSLVHACLHLALQADGASVVTAEGAPERGVAAHLGRILSERSTRCEKCGGALVLKAAEGARRRLAEEEIRRTFLEDPCDCGTAEVVWPQLQSLLEIRRQAAAAAERVAGAKPRRKKNAGESNAGETATDGDESVRAAPVPAPE